MDKVKIRIQERIFATTIGQPIINEIPESIVMKGCLKGLCRICRCQLLSGEVIENGNQVKVNADFLPCVSEAKSDIIIRPAVAGSSFKKSVVRSKKLLSNNVMKITLSIKSTFYNSKSIIVIKHTSLPDTRSYSIVSLEPTDYETLTIHVKIFKDGLFSNLFENLFLGSELDYIISNPEVISYQLPISKMNIVSGGSGMGAAISRAIDLSKKNKVEEIKVYAINRNSISNYHLHCIRFLHDYVDTVSVVNIPFTQWLDFEISEVLDSELLTIAVGSEQVIGKLSHLHNVELESFG